MAVTLTPASCTKIRQETSGPCTCACVASHKMNDVLSGVPYTANVCIPEIIVAPLTEATTMNDCVAAAVMTEKLNVDPPSVDIGISF